MYIQGLSNVVVVYNGPVNFIRLSYRRVRDIVDCCGRLWLWSKTRFDGDFFGGGRCTGCFGNTKVLNLSVAWVGRPLNTRRQIGAVGLAELRVAKEVEAGHLVHDKAS
jgi:hypothetical protein